LSSEGTVAYADGRAVEGLDVQAEAGGNTSVPFGGMMMDGNRSASTDGKGAFRIQGVGEGSYVLSVSIPWGSQINVKPKRVPDVAAGARGVKIVVDEGCTICGRILDSKRRPVTQAWINANPGVTPGEAMPG